MVCGIFSRAQARAWWPVVVARVARTLAVTALMSLLPTYGVLLPALYAFVLYGLRFALFASLAFHFSDSSRSKPHGRPHIDRPPNFRLSANLRRELGQSGLTLLIFAAVNAILYGYGLLHSSLLYFKVVEFPVSWFWASIPVMLALHDTLFYWLHRALHSRLLFAKVHRQHHDSVYPTAFAAYSFGWIEALAEALIVTAIIFIIPVHPLAFLVFQTLSTAYNVYGHCGREFFPESVSRHLVGRWINTSSLHAHHHRHGRGNYGFYFTFWDRVMGTLVPTAQK